MCPTATSRTGETSQGGGFDGLDLLSGAVAMLDAQGATVFLNDAAEELFAVSLRRVRGLPFAELFVDGAAVTELLRQARGREFDERRTELTLTRPGRDGIELLTDATVLDDPRGLLLLEFRLDVQRQRAVREERRRDALQAGNELVRGLAHEIRNPLGGIRGAAQLLEAELDAPALLEYTQVIVREVDRLRSLLDRLLEPHTGLTHLEEVNLHEVCERVRALALAEWPQGLEIERDYDASLPGLRADPEQLIQALLNLVRNAAQALEGRGRIRLVTRIARQVTIERRRYRLALDIHVIDDGPGVDPAVRERIFFPMVSTRPEGAGLGLTLAQNLVLRHGGVIECESRPGHTDFRILLPLGTETDGGEAGRATQGANR